MTCFKVEIQMCMSRAFSIVILLFVLPSCASTQHERHPDSLNGVIDVRLVMQVPNAHGVTVYLAPIPGGIYGSGTKGLVMSATVLNGDDFQMNIDDMTEAIQRLVKPAGTFETSKSPEVTPETARFGRVGTGHKRLTTGHVPRSSARFSDAHGQRLMLLYVAEAVSMTGKITSDDDATVASLSFPGPGFYWVEFVEENDDGNQMIIMPRKAVEDVRLIVYEKSESQSDD